ncbi:hypothetical protein C4D60_Mb01t17010 [Musa balbisiana]|uniref:Uncharacterized protein n=1 Tax=Musa balbisiana TaxID=52838 RepID=A0A4S8JN11_MUSBA|nr:hypothetical protein C4D60_Mb01t17010 [Musa balbisiana]
MSIWSDDAPTETRRNGGGQLVEEETEIREETRGKGKRKEAAAVPSLEHQNECRIMYGEAPSQVTDYGRGRSKPMRCQMGFATGRSIHGDEAEVVADTKRAIPGGPDPQHHSVNP